MFCEALQAGQQTVDNQRLLFLNTLRILVVHTLDFCNLLCVFHFEVGNIFGVLYLNVGNFLVLLLLVDEIAVLFERICTVFGF